MYHRESKFRVFVLIETAENPNHVNLNNRFEVRVSMFSNYSIELVEIHYVSTKEEANILFKRLENKWGPI